MKIIHTLFYGRVLVKRINGIPPTEVKALIESDHNIFRPSFGILSEHKERSIGLNPKKVTIIINVLLGVAWIAIYMFFVHPHFHRCNYIGWKLFSEYIYFMLTNNWVYLGVISLIINSLKIKSNEVIRKVRSRVTTIKEQYK